MADDITTNILVDIRDEIRATRDELRDELGGLRSELRATRAELRSELRATADRLDGRIDSTNQRLDVAIHHLIALTTEVREFKVETRDNFAGVRDEIVGVHRRLDNVIAIVGTHPSELETRVARIEDHLGLPR